jgi:N,N'-diacetyllegionaminate synthase
VELTRQAARAGADAVKLQLFDPRRLLSAQAGLARYQDQEDESDVFAMLDRIKMTAADMQQVRNEAHTLGLAFIVTPFSLEDIDGLRSLDVDLIKIASPDAVNVPLLEAASQLDKPMLISTGTCAANELEPACEMIGRCGGCLLQCVSSYPTSVDQAAIGGMIALRNAYALPVGYSDHTTDVCTGSLAVAAGACVIEKHFTYDSSAQGPDHAASF